MQQPDTATVVVHRPGATPVEHPATLVTPLVPGWTIEVEDLFTLPQ